MIYVNKDFLPLLEVYTYKNTKLVPLYR